VLPPSLRLRGAACRDGDQWLAAVTIPAQQLIDRPSVFIRRIEARSDLVAHWWIGAPGHRQRPKSFRVVTLGVIRQLSRVENTSGGAGEYDPLFGTRQHCEQSAAKRSLRQIRS